MGKLEKKLKQTAPERAKAKPKTIKEKTIGEEKPVETKVAKPKTEPRPSDAYRVLKSPVITEKATDLAEKNQYVFKVSSLANKTEVKKAVQNVYGVNVLSVKIINLPKKARIVGRKKGWKKGYKKAIVKIKKGQKIEVLPR